MSIHKISYFLVFVGALNWGLVGLFDFNLASYIFGGMPIVESVIYVLVGISAVLELNHHMCCCTECSMYMSSSTKSKKKR